MPPRQESEGANLFLGIDGGGSRTVAWLADSHNRIFARAVAGPSNPLKVGLAAAKRAVLQAAHLVMRRAGIRPKNLVAVCAGLAGVDRPSIQRPLSAWLRRAIPARFHLLTTDAAIALEAALGESAGVVVISGTGSIAFGRDERGRVVRSGGWGGVFDDAGSGYDLGRKAVAAALRHFDGRGPRTQLTGRICRALHLRSISEGVSKPLTPKEVAGLFPLVLEAARQGDSIARQLCEEAGAELARLALAALRRLRSQRHAIPVVCAGGVFRSSLRIRRSFARELRRHAPQARIMLLRRSPVEGALALARQLVVSDKE